MFILSEATSVVARLGRALQAAEDQLQRQAVLSALIRAVHSAPVAVGSRWDGGPRRQFQAATPLDGFDL